MPKSSLKSLVDSLFHYALPPARKNSYPEGWTTKGGVSLAKVKTKNLESKTHAGLYFAGEVLDFNGLCGGYNISFAMVSAQIVADDILGKSRI
jgi:predicted flavoprotein YhiN